MAPALPVFAGEPAPTGGARAKKPSGRKRCAVNVGAGLPAKQVTRCMAPAAPVFAGEPAPTGGARQETNLAQDMRRRCRSGFTREAGNTEHGTGCAGVRG
ncbi:hypothetical protein CHN49_10815 [Pseudomonas putida]|nr:hypothetical protein CHN49_10815 [Pseudomonas putida]